MVPETQVATRDVLRIPQNSEYVPNSSRENFRFGQGNWPAQKRSKHKKRYALFSALVSTGTETRRILQIA